MVPDPFGTVTKLVRINLVFTRIGSAIWYQMGPLMKVIPYEPYRSSCAGFRVNRVDPYHSGSDPKWILAYPIPCKRSLKHKDINGAKYTTLLKQWL